MAETIIGSYASVPPPIQPTTAGTYQYETWLQLRTQLANKLHDPTNVYWTDTELKFILTEAIRTFSMLTSYWRAQGIFNTVAGTGFYDLPTQLPTYLARNVTDQYLINMMEYHLQETPTTNWPGGWTGTDMFTMADLTHALQKRRNQFLAETGVLVTRTLLSTLVPVGGRIVLADNVTDVRRLAWTYLNNDIYNLWRVNEHEMTAFSQTWATPAVQDPTDYSILSPPPLTIQLNPAPSQASAMDLLSISSGADFNPTVGATLVGIPDDMSWIIKWGAMADLLTQDGPGMDPARGEYCVPLDSEILTKTGWKTYDALQLGEEILGYNCLADRCEWTPLLAINLLPQRSVHTYECRTLKLRSTAEHRWVCKERTSVRGKGIECIRKTAKVQSLDKFNTDALFVQAAKAPDGPGLGPVSIEDYLKRDKGVEMVLQMTSGERRAFILGMLYGEGHRKHGNGLKISSIFSQNPGPVYDAMKLACALEGISTSKGYKSAPPATTESFCLLQRPIFRRSLVEKAITSLEDVWCPTTGLGTWVMRQDSNITITGNCEQRYKHGVQLAQQVAVITAARVDNNPLLVSALGDLDAFRPGWQTLPNQLPDVLASAGLNLIALANQPDGAYPVTLDVIRNAPIPVNDGDYVQIGREMLTAILDYALHLAMFKVGGEEWEATNQNFEILMLMAENYNSRMSAASRIWKSLYNVTNMEEPIRQRIAEAPQPPQPGGPQPVGPQS